MTRYEDLIVYAQRIGADVKEIDFCTNKKYGKNIDDIIYINSKMSEIEKYEVLSEEIGHYKTTFGNITNQNKTENRKQELVARRHGYTFILRPLDIVYAMKCGCSNIYEIADFYELTVAEMTNIMDDFKKQYGIGKRFDKYFIAFEPTFAFIKMPDNENVS